MGDRCKAPPSRRCLKAAGPTQLFDHFLDGPWMIRDVGNHSGSCFRHRVNRHKIVESEQ